MRTTLTGQLPDGPAALIVYTIYGSNNIEYPGSYVIRRWSIEGGHETNLDIDQPMAVIGSLRRARGVLPPGLTCFQRAAEDDPCIVETWM